MKKMSTIYDNLETYLNEGSEYEKYILSLPEVSPGEIPEMRHKLSSHSLLRWHANKTQKQVEFVGLDQKCWSLERKLKYPTDYPDFNLPLDELVRQGFTNTESIIVVPSGSVRIIHSFPFV